MRLVGLWLKAIVGRQAASASSPVSAEGTPAAPSGRPEGDDAAHGERVPVAATVATGSFDGPAPSRPPPEADSTMEKRQPAIARDHPAPPRDAGPRPGEYERWVLACDTLTERDRSRIRQAVATMPRRPRICVVMIAADDGAAGQPELTRSVEGLESQLYADWELLLPPGLQASPRLGLRASALQRPDLGSVATATNAEYIAFLTIGDRLAEHALYLMAKEATRYPEAGLLYSDEDAFDPETGVRSDPDFKPAWDPDLFLGRDYACRLALLRSDALAHGGPLTPAGVYETLLRQAMRSDAEVVHVPRVLYHRASPATRPAPRPDDAMRAAAARWLAECVPGAVVAPLQPGGFRHVVWPLPALPPAVSLIVPTKDQPALLRDCVEGLRHATDYPSIEIVIVDNGSEQPETLAYLEGIAVDDRVRVLRYDAPFNYAAINNFAARGARGAVFGLLNNDIKVMEPGWLREMVSLAVRPDVGAVGAGLHFADGTVQHAGVVLGMSERRLDGVAAHVGRLHAGDSPGYAGCLRLVREVSAVTAACMLVPRAVWEEVGGFDEAFAVAFNDVDLCLRIRETERRVLWTPFARLWHLESQSRGREDSPEKRLRTRLERDGMWERWGEALRADPFFSPNLSLASVDWRPAFPPRLPAMPVAEVGRRADRPARQAGAGGS